MSPFEVGLAHDQWCGRVTDGALLASTGARYSQVFDSFCRYAEAIGVRSLEQVTPSLCQRFLGAPLRGDRRPSTATSRLRLTVLRSAFDALVSRGVIETNPTTDLAVPHVVRPRVPCPLTPFEVRRLLLAGRSAPDDSLRPAACALALLGAAHGEIALSSAADFQPSTESIQLGEGAASRLLDVPPMLTPLLTRRLVDLRRASRSRKEDWDPAQVSLALNRSASSYPVNSVAPTVSENLARAIRHAGVSRAGVGPRSLREYAANAALATTGRIEAVARQLGLSSFDTAARLIDPAWQGQWGEAVRNGSGCVG